jgi:hypothetical protein
MANQRTITYDELREQLVTALLLPPNATAGTATNATGSAGSITTKINTDNTPQGDSNTAASSEELNKLLGVRSGNDGKVNNYGGVGSQVIINSDRLIFNARTDFLMLFGQDGVAIASPGNVNVDADEAITLYGDDGVYLGAPGKGDITKKISKPPKNLAEPTVDLDYEPLVLGAKLADLLDDLITVIKNATVVTPTGKAYLAADTGYELRCIQARIPEIVSTYAFIDGISHEAPDPAPDPPTGYNDGTNANNANTNNTISNTNTGNTGNTGNNTGNNSSGATNVTDTDLTKQSGYYDAIDLYNL